MSEVELKSPEEFEKMRIAGQMAAEVLDMIGQHVVPGVTTEALDNICHHYITEVQKAIPACLGYKGFPKSICTSVNHVVCHGIPSEKKKLKKEDIINIDVTVIHEGYHGDTSKMFVVGKTSILANRLIKIAQECLYIGISMVKPGVHLGDIGAAIQKHAESNRFSVVRVFCGHGIGRNFHEPPQVLHYGTPGTGEQLEEGMCLTIEPMVNVGVPDVTILKDGWTAVTKDRKLSAQWEHTLGVTSSGVEVFTLRKEESI